MTHAERSFIRTLLGSAIVVTTLTGCVSIAPQAADASHQVARGIDRLAASHIDTIRAFADAQRETVKLVWDHEHLPQIMTRIREQSTDPPGSDVQIMRIAATAADLRTALLADIDAHEQQLIAQVRTNQSNVRALADAVSGYLHAAADAEYLEHTLQSDILNYIANP